MNDQFIKIQQYMIDVIIIKAVIAATQNQQDLQENQRLLKSLKIQKLIDDGINNND